MSRKKKVEVEKIKYLLFNGHKRCIDSFFERSISKNETLYIKILERHNATNDSEFDNYDKSEDVVHITLISEEMLMYDEFVYNKLADRNKDTNRQEYNNGIMNESIENEDLILDSYRPYFFEFIVNLNDVDEKTKKFLTQSDYIGKWIEARFIDANFENDDAAYNISGTVLFSASPFKTIKRKLIIQDRNPRISKNINDWVKRLYDTSTSVKNINEIQDILNDIFNDPEPSDYKVRIYNVGDGNCIYIYCDNGRRILFDIGHNYNPYSKDWRAPEIRRTQYAIKQMKPNATILSHWDLDHVIGVVFAKQDVFRIPWIAPNINVLPKRQMSMGSLRVAKYLELYNRLFLVDNNLRNKLIYSTSTKSLKIWHGKGKEFKLTETNNAGLIIEFTKEEVKEEVEEKVEKKVKNGVKKEVRTLLPGDCEYLALPEDLGFSTKRFNHLVVPHHCSSMDTTCLNTTSKDEDIAIISVSKNNSIRPNREHRNFLEESANYKVELTGGRFCIDIPSLGKVGIKIIQ